MSTAFETNSEYMVVMKNWHAEAGGCHFEPRVKDIILSHCKPGRLILDAGCGDGSPCRWFAARNPRTSFIGVDISPIGIEMASSLPNAHFEVDSLRNLPFPSGSFDFIYCNSVLEHVKDWKQALREMYRVVKPGGEVLVRLGNAGRIDKKLGRALLDVILSRNKEIACTPSFELEEGNRQQHMTNWDEQEIPSDVLEAQMKHCGFNMVLVSTCQDELKDGSSGLKRRLLSLIGSLNFWPFNHLGYTSILVGRK